MCLAIPGKVKKISGMKITVEYPGETRQILDGGIPVKVGEYVMVQMGVVIKKLTPGEAKVAQTAWK
jgi:hydrogenase assembly chaperone HypC/HupF